MGGRKEGVMPREHVLSCFARREDEPPPDGPQLPDFRVQVGWGANDYVQIATVNPAADLGSVESGLYVDLDRKGINDLIRLLRKARDRAYGRDE
jgi:hypothetical protein